MTEEEFERIYRLLKTQYGINLERKKEIVKGRLENYVRLGGYSSYTAYLNAVEADATGRLKQQLINLLTTNHTFFMREFEHMDFMREEVLPYLRKKEAARKDLGIWCGAASTGEEPYMLAMLMNDFFGLEHGEWDTTLLATDLSTEALKKAMRGEYTYDQVKNLPDTWKRRYFKSRDNGEHFEVTKEIKDQIFFRQFNLMDPFPFRRKFHVVFMRNVMIYFDARDKRRLVQKIYDYLEPGGYLFVGRTETIDRNDSGFMMVQPSIFRKPLDSKAKYEK